MMVQFRGKERKKTHKKEQENLGKINRNKWSDRFSQPDTNIGENDCNSSISVSNDHEYCEYIYR